MNSLQDVYIQLGQARSFSEAWSRLIKILTDQGVSHVGFALAYFDSGRPPSAECFFINTFPESFAKRYKDAGHIDYDHAFEYCREKTLPTKYYDSYMSTLTKRQMQIEHEAQEHGLKRGILIPLRLNNPLHFTGSGLTFSSMSEKEFDEYYNNNLNYLTSVLQAFLGVTHDRGLFGQMVELTEREREFLFYSFLGKKRDEIAKIRNVDVGTVNQTAKNVFRKLKVANINQAISRSIAMRIILPI